MNIVIAGAGTVGRYLAEILSAAGNNVTVIDSEPSKLAALENELDIRTLKANAAHADAQREAGVRKCDMFIAATNHDEVNILAASAAKALGADKCVARVHHSAYFSGRGLDYNHFFHIDSLICPEHATAVAIARTLRNPGALAVENFARGVIEMQQLKVVEKAPGVGVPLSELKLPKGVRIATVTRDDQSFIPSAGTVIQPDDIATLIGEKGELETARRMFQTDKIKRKHVIVLGGTSMGVWLCRTLRQRHFAVRLFLTERARAEELAAKLRHVTVIEADPTEPSVFSEEHIADVDAFVTLTDDDEHNILAAAQAKSFGVKMAITVIQRSAYLHLLEHVGIDRAFSPRQVAAKEIQLLLEPGPVRVLASLVEATADVYEVQVAERAPVVDKALKAVTWPSPCVIGAIQRGEEVFVPGADHTLQGGDTVLVIGARGLHDKFKKLFGGK
jgi:trk system potassium uptake protein TrkA